MAAAIPFVALAATVGGQVYQGIQENKQAKREAAILEQEGVYQKQKAVHEEKLSRRDAHILQGRQQALLSAGGQPLTSATALNLLTESTTQEELDALTIRYGGDVAAASARSKASAVKKAGKSALTSSFFKAGGSLLTGGSQIYGGGKGSVPTIRPTKTKRQVFQG